MLWNSMILLTCFPGQNDTMEERVRLPWKGDDIWWGLSRPAFVTPLPTLMTKTTTKQQQHKNPSPFCSQCSDEIKTYNRTGKFPFSIFLLWPQLNDHRTQANPKLINVARKMTLMKKKKKIHVKYFKNICNQGFFCLGNWFFHLSP